MRDEPRSPAGLFVLEQTLGHVTHGQNLRRLVALDGRIEPTFVPVEFDRSGWARRVPGWGNWTVRAGVRARRALRRVNASGFDAMFVHTQVPAVLLGRWMDLVPTVVSLDATPKQYDALGEHYRHDVGPAWLERIKTTLNRRCFERAAHIVTWAEWTRRSVVDDYGIDPDRITVIPPGVDVDRWRPPSDLQRDDDVVRILFVGGDLDRKGGNDLMTAFARLRDDHGSTVELHIVSPTPIDDTDGVTSHRSMTPNSPELIELYHRCHVFCLPTKGDCLPMVLPEAAAAGLALISTDVGAIGEIVRPDETGLLVDVGDVDGLTTALERLATDHELRRRLATAATRLVERDHDAARNAARIADLVRTAARPEPGHDG